MPFKPMPCNLIEVLYKAHIPTQYEEFVPQRIQGHTPKRI